MKNLTMKNRPSITVLCLVAFLIVLVSGCDVKKNKDVKPQEDFLKIYDDQSFSASYTPIDIQQTSDEGYIILAKTRIDASSFYGIYLLKADKNGNFVSENKVASTYVSPGNSLMKVGGSFYFFCMNNTSLATVLMSVDENIATTTVKELPGILYPLSSYLEESTGNFLLQSYDRDDKATLVSKINTSGVVLDSLVFNIGYGNFDVEEPIIDHLTGNGKQLPFLAGSMGNGTYFFNGFYNYTLSMVFFSFGGTSAPGLLQGYRTDRCISSALYLSDIDKFALSGYAYGNNTIYSSASINYKAAAVASGSDLQGGFPIPEFNVDARVILKKETLKSKSVLIYGSDTKSGQIALYLYDATAGNFIASKHLGYTNTFFMGNFIKTKDEGIAVAGVTYLSGRFPRVCLFKIPKEDIEALIQ
jgi:hypothetical protein